MTSIFRLSLILILAAAVVSCSNDTEAVEKDTPVESDTPAEQPAPSSEYDQKIVHLETYTTKTGKQFIVTVKPLSASVSRITVQGMGFPETQGVFSYRNSDPVENAQLTDLDGDGFEELYIITRSVGSGSYGTLRAFASIGDKAIAEVEVPPFEGPYYEGFRGKGVFTFQGNRVIHFWPVYNEGDTNANPTGGSRLIFYRLDKEGDGARLVIDSAQKTN